MNKKAVGVFALSLAHIGSAAHAADMAVTAPVYKAPPLPAPVYTWTGFYIGVNGGVASAHKCWDVINDLGTPIVPAVPDSCQRANGGIVGGQVGYRWQAASWVFGVEAQGDWADLTGSSESFAFGPGLTNCTKVDALGLFTGQVGYAWNNVLWFVKGGAAVTHDKYNGIDDATGVAVDQASETRWGAAVGTGLRSQHCPKLVDWRRI